MIQSYIVQCRAGCTVFVHLDLARRHAALNAPATIWNSEDVTAIYHGAITIHADATPIATIWDRSCQ